MIKACSVMTVLAAAGSALAQVGVDGSIGAEWSAPGIVTNSVAYDPAAPVGNFGTPGPTNHTVAYNTYLRSDGSFVYLAVQANPAGGGSAAGLQFMNIYLSTNPALGSNVGLEVTNNNFFIPGGAGGYNAAGVTTWSSSVANGVIEVAIPTSFFTSDPLGMGFAPATSIVQWRISQSFGYSAAGGASYGADRLGIVQLPTPGAAAAVGLGGLAALRRRRR